jgi:hypothetical protein
MRIMAAYAAELSTAGSKAGAFAEIDGLVPHIPGIKEIDLLSL